MTGNVQAAPHPCAGQIWLLGRTDEAQLLADIVGWSVGCYNEENMAAEVAELRRRGLIKIRRHKAPCGEWDCYALTEAGFRRLKQIDRHGLYAQAVGRHEWYAERGSL